MRRRFCLVVSILLLTGFVEFANAQRFSPYYSLKMLRFNVEWHGVRDDKTKDKYTGYLKWELDKQHHDPGLYYIKFRATEQQGVFYVIRMLPDTDYEVYGRGESLINDSRQLGLKLKILEGTDLTQPYVIKRQKDAYEVFNYTDTTVLTKLFETLDQWLYMRMIPKANGEPFEQKLFQKTELEMGSAITFTGKKDWRWDIKTNGEVLAKNR